jgi:hypothetical protein
VGTLLRAGEGPTRSDGSHLVGMPSSVSRLWAFTCCKRFLFAELFHALTLRFLCWLSPRDYGRTVAGRSQRFSEIVARGLRRRALLLVVLVRRGRSATVRKGGQR